MANKNLLLIAALLLAACSADPTSDTEKGTPQTAVSQKLVNTAADAQQGSLIIYFDENVIPNIEQAAAASAVTRSAVTRSGLTSVDDVLAGLNVRSLSRIFAENPRTEERARAAGLHRWYVVSFDEQTDLESAALKLAALAEVKRVQFDTKMYKASDCKVYPLREEAVSATRAQAADLPFNDNMLSRQWNYINTGDKSVTSTVRSGADINVKDAWKLTAGNPAVIVAVVDEGVKYTHPDLAANMWVNKAELNGAPGVDDDKNGYVDDIHGYNFVSNGPISWNVKAGQENGDSGHGTHVAGTVAAVNNNGQGVCGVAGGTGNNDGVKLMSCQIFSGGGGGTMSIVAAAVKYAADNGASIIQCSFGIKGGIITSDIAYERSNGAEMAAYHYFIGTKNSAAIDGGLVIFSAGNENTGMSGYPAAYREFISVTAFSPDYLPAYYTNYGPGCNIAAPGGDAYIPQSNSSATVLSTITSEAAGTDYGYMQGTSMACPHVSGVAALGLSYALAKGKHYTIDQFKSMLLTSVNNIDTYLEGTKQSKFTMQLGSYRKKMGTGAVDAYQLLMQIEGTPCIKAKVGTKQLIQLTSFFGASAANLTYLNVKMSQADMTKLGITDAPAMVFGKLQIKCTKPGVAKITVSAIAGGDKLGTSGTMGGLTITKEFAIIAREVQAENGGWL